MHFDDLQPLRAELANGVELHYVRHGAGHPLIFVHGAMGDWRSWEPQWDAFTPHYDCVTYSRRYSFPNRNNMPSPHHSALIEAEDLRLFMDHLGWHSAILVGSSYGGFTALALAVAAPERVDALVAAEPVLMPYAFHTEAGRAAHATFLQGTITPANAAFRRGEDEAAARIMTGGINGARALPAHGSAMQRRLQNIRAMKMLALSSNEFPLLAPARLQALRMPMMLFSGRETAPIHAAIFENLCAVLPEVPALRVEGAGHGLTREQPAAFNTAALQFLARSLNAAGAQAQRRAA